MKVNLRPGLALALALTLVTSGTGCGSSSGSGGESTVVAPANVKNGRYRYFAEASTQNLVRALQAMLPEIESGEVARAESRYARARVYYSQVEPAAETFGTLNTRIDGLEREVDPADFGGFHRIEKALFLEETTKGMTPVARRLLADAKSLQPRLQTAKFSALELAEGAARILTEISRLKLDGLEEPYSNAGLVDVSANVEAVAAALDALQPAVSEPHELEELSRRLHRTFKVIEQYGTPARDPDQPRGRSPGAIFTSFEELSPAEIGKLRAQIEALAEPVAELRDQFAAAER